MLVVDTNILFPYFVACSFTDKVEALYRLDPDWCTEPFALYELSNILATYERTELLNKADALACLNRMEAWVALHSHVVQAAETLAMAMRYRITAYDARFLLLARNLGRKLITEDKKLRAAAPDLTQSIDEALRHQ